MIYWKIGSTKNIGWSFPDVLSDVEVLISRDNGSTWNAVVADTVNTGSYIWTVTGPESDLCLMKVTGLGYIDPVDGSTIDFSDIVAISQSVFGISLTKDTSLFPSPKVELAMSLGM